MGNGVSKNPLISACNIRKSVVAPDDGIKEVEKSGEYDCDAAENTEDNCHVWIDVKGKPQKVKLSADLTPLSQRKKIAQYFGLSPAVRIHTRDKASNAINDKLQPNNPNSCYSIECEMGMPPGINEDEENSNEADVTVKGLSHVDAKAIMESSNFDMWSFCTEELICFIEVMFQDLGIIEELKTDKATLRNFLIAVEHNYRTVPFHNFRHAFSVTHMMYFIIRECDLHRTLTTLQIGVLLVACICHDLDHPGLNNVYQINAQTELSRLYMNCSPLEHHHCAVAFQLLSVKELNIFRNLDPEAMAAVTTVMIHLILATDMAYHSEILEDFLQKVRGGLDIERPDHSLSLQKILIKCCDISNEVRPLEYSEPWVDRLMEEFFLQADTERQEGLPVASFMDKDTVQKFSNQLKFIRGTLMPLFSGLSEVLPSVKRNILKSLNESEWYYERMCQLKKEKEKENQKRTDEKMSDVEDEMSQKPLP